MEPTRSHLGQINSFPPAKALMSIRIIWLALLLGQLMFMAVIILAILPNPAVRRGFQPQPVLNWLPFIVLATFVPVAFFIRRAIHKKTATAQGIRPGGYTTGNIVFWAACEGCAFLGLIAIMLNGKIWPVIIAVAIALFLQALTFPTGAGIDFSSQMGASRTG